MKPIKACMAVATDGKMYWYNIMPYRPNKAMRELVSETGQTIIPVLITPITPKKKGKKLINLN